jgi:hypothetical protein
LNDLAALVDQSDEPYRAIGELTFTHWDMKSSTFKMREEM